MKTKEIIPLLFFFLMSCSDDTPNFKQQVLFEKHYSNWAWGYQENGYLIDSLGNVKSFDLTKETSKWNYADSLGYISKEKMDKNLQLCRTIIKQINRDSLTYFTHKIPGAAIGKLSEPEAQMADFGEIRYYAYIFDKKTNRYKQVMIKTYGDFMIENNAAEANEIYQWMSKITIP